MVSIGESFEFPCGLKVSNRIVKAAMEESLGEGDNQPNHHIYRLYERWAAGSFGFLLTGNVQIDERYPGLMTDLMIPSDDRFDLSRWKKFADICQSHGTPTIVQINHGGRQSFLGKRPFRQPPIAPSAIPLAIGDGWFARLLQRFLLVALREMTRTEIEQTIEQFGNAAKLMFRAGFAGVEIHGSHGYLVSSFLSPKTNRRTDEFGGTAKNRMQFLFRIIDNIRSVVPSTFAVGVKLNSADFSVGGLTEEEAADQIRWLDEHGGIDFIEISGGTYEAPAMAGVQYRTRQREAYFIDFAAKVRDRTRIPLIVTGGFRTRQGMNEALRSNACDFVGIGRPACLQMDLPKILLDRQLADEDARALSYEIRGKDLFHFIPIQTIGSGIGTMWHNWQMHRVAIENRQPDVTLSVQEKLFSIVLKLIKRSFFYVFIFFLFVYFLWKIVF